MISRKTLVLGLACVLFAPGVSFAQNKFEHAEYLRAATAGQKKGDPVKGTLTFDGGKKEVVFLGSKDAIEQLRIPYSAIKTMLYEKTAKPRYAAGLLIAWPLLFTKSKQHYLTIQYNDAAGTGQYAVIHLDKNNARQALAAAEAETGKKVERAEEK